MDIKRIAIFFEDSRLWLGGNLWCSLQKRVAFEGDKERLVRIESFLFVKKVGF